MLLNKIDSSSVSKDGKIEAVHDLLEQQETLCLLQTLMCSEAGGKSRRRQASVNSDVVSNVFCSRTADTSNKYL